MGHGTYYNEIDTFAAEWLRNLIKKGLIPDGEVDTRSIADVVPSDLGRFRQHHFFAGIGGWSYALRLAGWPDDRPVWTGSCPCQPFSVAGKGKGVDDERHLWPEFHRLISECRPSIVFGEQVASRAGREWFAGVRADLENVGYGAAAADLCAPGVGAPHIRQRLYWVATNVADAQSLGWRGRAHDEDEGRREQPSADTCAGSGDVADAESQREPSGTGQCAGNGRGGFFVAGSEQGRDGIYDGEPVCDVGDAEELFGNGGEHNHRSNKQGQRQAAKFGNAGGSVNVGNADGSERAARDLLAVGDETRPECLAQSSSRGDVADADDAGREGRTVHAERPDEGAPWSHGVEWRRGADGKERRVKPGVRLLVDGVPNRVGRLRGYGNAIVPQVAAEFIRAFSYA